MIRQSVAPGPIAMPVIVGFDGPFDDRTLQHDRRILSRFTSTCIHVTSKIMCGLMESDRLYKVFLITVCLWLPSISEYYA